MCGGGGGGEWQIAAEHFSDVTLLVDMAFLLKVNIYILM